MGDQVLVMTPSMTGKLDDQWTGSYIIAEKMNEESTLQTERKRADFSTSMGFAQLTARISDLTRKEELPTVNWTAQHKEDFQKLKALMCNMPILHCPDESRKFLL